MEYSHGLGFLDNLIKYMNYDDEYIRLAAARAVEFLSNNINIKEELAGNMELRTIMVMGVVAAMRNRPACTGRTTRRRSGLRRATS